MLNEQSETIKSIILIALIISLLADFVLRASWNKIYFTFGIPIFVMRVPVNKSFKGVPYQYLFEEEFRFTWFAPALSFKVNGARKIFFREKFFDPPIRYRYLPIMHGVISFEHDKKRVVVTGLANWFPLWLMAYIALVWFNLTELLPVQITGSTVIIVVLLVVFYLIQYVRFSRIGKYAAELCSSKHFLNSKGG